MFTYSDMHINNIQKRILRRMIVSLMSSNFPSLSLSKTDFLIIILRQQLAKLSNPTISVPNSVTLSPVASVRNFGVIFYSILSFFEHNSSISTSWLHHYRHPRRLGNSMDQTTVCTIVTTLVHSKIDY
jgi:hypothetical protein